MKRAWLLVALCACTSGTIGEGLRATPHEVGPFDGALVDAAASELLLLTQPSNDTGHVTVVTGDQAKKFRDSRDEMAEGLTALFGGSNTSKRYARFRVALGFDSSFVTSALPCLLVFTFFGCPATTYQATVDLTLESQDGKLYKGHGEGKSYAYVTVGDHAFDGPVAKIAVGKALGAALDDALARGSAR